ncbi:MAG: hypothetical protein C4294_10080, partial [Nitrospiraceae bacterium]
MSKTGYLASVAGLMGIMAVGAALTASAGGPGMSDQQRVQQQMGSSGSAMGVPEPGTVSDMEKTEKQPNMTDISNPESSAQVTLGGANYFVEGEVLKI